MSRRIIGILLIIIGWLAGGIGFSEPVGPPWNTLLFLVMFPLIIIGISLLIRKKNIDSLGTNKKSPLVSGLFYCPLQLNQKTFFLVVVDKP